MARDVLLSGATTCHRGPAARFVSCASTREPPSKNVDGLRQDNAIVRLHKPPCSNERAFSPMA